MDSVIKFKCLEGTTVEGYNAKDAQIVAAKQDKTLLIDATKEQLEEYIHNFGKNNVNISDACQIDHLQDLI